MKKNAIFIKADLAYESYRSVNTSELVPVLCVGKHFSTVVGVCVSLEAELLCVLTRTT